MRARGAISSTLPRAFEPRHLDGAALVIAATDSREVNAAVSLRARAARAVSRSTWWTIPQLSTFIFPAIIDRSPVIVAVGTEGSSPVLARRVREQLEALLPARARRPRPLCRRAASQDVQQALPPRQRRPFWERIIGGIVALASAGWPGGGGGSPRSIAAAAFAHGEAHVSGEVYLIGAGPGDPDLLTLRALQLLQQADVMLYDRLVSDAVLDRARRDAERVFVGKEAGEHHVTQERIHELLVRLRARRACASRASKAAIRSSSDAAAKRSRCCEAHRHSRSSSCRASRPRSVPRPSRAFR